MNLLVTGGAGFIGSNFVRHWAAAHPKDRITVLDLLTYAGNLENIREFVRSGKVRFVKGDIGNAALADKVMKGQDAVFHFAAESHVDRSILDSQVFLKTNILGTQTLLEAARRHGLKKFVFVSTDEVYGSILKGTFKEGDPLEPNSPYASSKAAADLLCRSYWITYGLPVVITRCCNNFICICCFQINEPAMRK
jgi:dTDP-glucose 4,6-dehydratase